MDVSSSPWTPVFTNSVSKGPPFIFAASNPTDAFLYRQAILQTNKRQTSLIVITSLIGYTLLFHAVRSLVRGWGVEKQAIPCFSTKATTPAWSADGETCAFGDHGPVGGNLGDGVTPKMEFSVDGVQPRGDGKHDSGGQGAPGAPAAPRRQRDDAAAAGEASCVLALMAKFGVHRNSAYEPAREEVASPDSDSISPLVTVTPGKIPMSVARLSIVAFATTKKYPSSTTLGALGATLCVPNANTYDTEAGGTN